MADICFLLGAGVNCTVADWDGLRPPLARDFFRYALAHRRLGSKSYIDRTSSVYDFILKYWKLTIQDLRQAEFDLEACYSLLQLQAERAQVSDDIAGFRDLMLTEFRLTTMLAEYLADIEHFASLDDTFRTFGQRLLSQRPAILTFNYDTLIESALESASHVRASHPVLASMSPPFSEPTGDELSYSHFNWNRPLAYGIQFDDVHLQRAGTTTIVSGDSFYAHPANVLYDPPLLTLHGSINWFAYTGIPRFPIPTQTLPDRKGKTLLYRGHWWNNEPADVSNEIIRPLIVTPVFRKDLRPFYALWAAARQHLEGCRRLVIIGYSFPKSDFHAQALLLEAFASAPPAELTIVNPDPTIAPLAAQLTHFSRAPETHADLAAYLACPRCAT